MLFFYVLPNFCKHCFGSPLVLAAAQNLMAFHVGGGGGVGEIFEAECITRLRDYESHQV